MNDSGAQALVLAGVLTALAALAHLACIAVGASAFRFMGAGERMARAVEAGQVRPVLITVFIAAVLAVCAACAFSAAGIVAPLPLAEGALPIISAAFLGRALAFPLLRPVFPDNSTTFWWVSSGICLWIGGLYGFGAAAIWARA